MPDRVLGRLGVVMLELIAKLLKILDVSGRPGQPKPFELLTQFIQVNRLKSLWLINDIALVVSERVRISRQESPSGRHLARH